MRRSLHAFVDEYGNTSIMVEKPGTSDCFILTAVLIYDEELNGQRAATENIRKEFFQTGEMKSSGVADNDERRIRILRAINTLRIRTFTMIIDKKELSRASGLAWKGSFFKYLNRRLYDRIHRLFEGVSLIADEYGDDEFMQGFKKYIERKIPFELFARNSFQQISSKKEVFLQVADMVSGSFARCFDPGKISPRATEILELLSDRSIGIEAWPPRRIPDPKQFIDESQIGKHDELVRRHCLRKAQIYLETADRSEPSMKTQVEVLEYLLFQAQYIDDRAFVPTAKILEHLAEHAAIVINDFQLRTNVISKLRDLDIIIASGPKGYKLPVSESDMAQYVAHANTIVPPMLARLRRARQELHAASMGELDILAHNELQYLRSLVDQTSGIDVGQPLDMVAAKN